MQKRDHYGFSFHHPRLAFFKKTRIGQPLFGDFGLMGVFTLKIFGGDLSMLNPNECEGGTWDSANR